MQANKKVHMEAGKELPMFLPEQRYLDPKMSRIRVGLAKLPQQKAMQSGPVGQHC